MDNLSLTSSGKPCKKCLRQGKQCAQHASIKHSLTRQTPSKSSSASVRPTPRKKVRFPKTLEKVKKIPALTPKSPKGVMWAKPVTDLQAECVSSVIEVYGIWDEEDLALTRKKLSQDQKSLIGSCIKVMKGNGVTKAEEDAIREFSSERERRRDVYRRETIERENNNLKIPKVEK